MRMRLRLSLVAAVVLASTFAMCGEALAQSSGYLVTFAARSCPAYTDITANLARNDIQESLRDLGSNTLYVSGEPISPAKEQAGQSNCTPIANWRFTLGTGYASRAVSGPWGSLSKVTGAFDTSVVTRSSVPLLDTSGQRTGQRLSGAVTVALTDEQAQLATQYSALWAQGGTPDDPVLNTPYPGMYGFGALRCAVDNLNGDNVEYLQYPQGTRHIFCFAYYVTPPPTSGTIIVRKDVTDPSVTSPQPFSYHGNISYTTDHTFSLSADYQHPDETSFVRGETGPSDPPWTFTEDQLAGWTLTGLSCTSALGNSATSTDLATGAVSVTLGAEDTVTCTFSNRLVPPDGHLILAKQTLGGTGSFPFTVTGPKRASQTLTTHQVGVPVTGSPLALPTGTYHVTEQLPHDSAGHWSVVGVICNGDRRAVSRTATVAITAGSGALCLFRNRFTPVGSIRLHKVTLGGVGTALFGIRAISGTPATYRQFAKTTHPGRPVLATGDDTTRLPLGPYALTESASTTPAGKQWILDHVLCNGRPAAAARGRLIVHLTSRQPNVDCTAVNRLVSGPPTPTPPPSPTPTPTPTPTPIPTPTPAPAPRDLVPADGPIANLSVTKTASPTTAQPGQPIRYTIVVVNHGPDTAENVVAAELSRGRASLQIHASQGHCTGQHPASCQLGSIRPGKRVVITVIATQETVGFHTDRVGVTSSSADPILANNTASATVLIRPLAPPPGRG